MTLHVHQRNMTFLRPDFFLATLLLAYCSLPIGNVRADQFQWVFSTGDQFDVTLNHATASDSKVGNFNAKQTYSYQLQTHWKVTEVNSDQVATIEKTIKSIGFAIASDSPIAFSLNADTQTEKSGGKTFSGTEGSTVLKHLQTLIGKKLSMQIKPNGEIEMLPLRPQTQAAIDAFPKSDYVLQMFDISSVAESETSYFVTLPSRSIELGETWLRESGTDVNKNESFVTQFKYFGDFQERDPPLVDFGISVFPKQAGDRVLQHNVPTGGNQAATVSKQTGSGNCFFDPEKKHFTSANYRSEIVSSGSGQSSAIISDFATKIVRK